MEMSYSSSDLSGCNEQIRRSLSERANTGVNHSLFFMYLVISPYGDALTDA